MGADDMETHEGLRPGQTLVTLPINEVTPYWRNPRRISDEAVNALAQSIRRYGYLQPIVVDGQHVIVIGHTRYAAIRRLGYTEVEVLVDTALSDLEAKQLRTIDNKVSEFTSWDFDKLLMEVEGLDEDLMRSYFPDVVGPDEPSGTHVLEIDRTAGEQESADVAEFICPSCFHGWEQRVRRDEVLVGTITGRDES